MIAATKVTARPTEAPPPNVPIHFPAEARSRMHDELLYQCAATRLVQAALGVKPGSVFSTGELAAMRVAYTRGFTFEQFAQCVIDAREMANETVSA